LSPTGDSYAYGINAAGTTVGKSKTTSGTYHAFAVPKSSFEISPLTDDLGTLAPAPNDNSAAHAINGLGQIVGDSMLSAGVTKAVLKQPGTARDVFKNLGDLGGNFSSGLAVNNRGQVVGYSKLSSGAFAASIWLPGWTSVRSLKSFLSSADQLAWDLAQATGISDDGKIVGYGYKSGVANAFVISVK
jgi:probable HAF family extracellular repeat protein